MCLGVEARGRGEASGSVLWWTHLLPRLPLASGASWYELGRASLGKALLQIIHTVRPEAPGLDSRALLLSSQTAPHTVGGSVCLPDSSMLIRSAHRQHLARPHGASIHPHALVTIPDSKPWPLALDPDLNHWFLLGHVCSSVGPGLSPILSPDPASHLGSSG